jgi:hypothetical protein
MNDFERSLCEVAQELNDALETFEMIGSKANAMNVISAAQRAVSIIEKTHPALPLYKSRSAHLLH